ncbi:hypothetical protein GDO86_012779 [Hymenochirus boettgeri]|uniref:Uncharacterized protein n=1 Tax=Hymenochirus boettgeri TaxID=247094 RepID=A0A8T2INN3_9PIPI|nr:hypothetical protein GDO86_012779 [Hymenochirus boettgeri]
MKLLPALALITLLAICTVSAEETSLISSTITYAQEVSGDLANKAKDALDSVTQNAVYVFDLAFTEVNNAYGSVVKTLIDKWSDLTNPQ